MKILFRTDGNGEIGAGHIMRCLAFANAAKKRGIECIFIMAGNDFEDKVNEWKYRYYILGTDYRNMEEEYGKFSEILKTEKPEYIFVDSYYVTQRYFEWLREYAPIIYVDDIASFAYNVNILVNYNIYGSDIKYSSLYRDANIQIPFLFYGTSYAPLREEFQKAEIKILTNEVRNILVSVGGADPEGIALKLAQTLIQKEEYSEQFTFHFIIGAFEPDKKKLYEFAEKYSWIQLHENVKKMSELMKQCDVAIAAAGSTLYELCACGVPTLTYILADNQILGAKAFEKKGLMLCAGDYRKQINFFDDLMKLLKSFICNFNLRKKMAENQQRVVDGNGADRLIEELILLD